MVEPRILLWTQRVARLMMQTADSAVLAFGKPTNHILHLLLSVFTCGLWVAGLVFDCQGR